VVVVDVDESVLVDEPSVEVDVEVDVLESVDPSPLPLHAYAVPTPSPRQRASELALTAAFRARTLCMGDSFRGFTSTTRANASALGRTRKVAVCQSDRYLPVNPTDAP
jgi:hypothetical protein